MSDDKIKRGTDDLRNSEYGKTWVISTDESISQALTEILRATMEDEEKIDSRGVLFYIANQSQPLIITDVDIIRIGRSSETDTDITLDLNKYHGTELGVSRHHAEISFRDGTYYIKDMGSTNGTWVNSSKIDPYRQIVLQDSDQLRLGHFTMLVKFVN
ncbi:MAG: hypothetical protein Phog2KO_21090 [Phototrophicaceae bacterium]